MGLIRQIITEEYVYDSKDKQIKHRQFMADNGWESSGQVRKNFGSLYDRDESNSRYFSAFSKVSVGYNYDEKTKKLTTYELNEHNEYEESQKE